MNKKAKHFYEFGLFRLDLEEHLLMHEGRLVHLAPKVLDMLMVLIERRGHVVGKDEMMNLLWPDSFVEESNLTQNIFTLRKALDDGSDNVQYIETVPRRGYRFVANVRDIREEDIKEIQEEARALTEEATTPATSGLDDVPEMPTRRAGALTSLAVLPMVSESTDPNVEFLMDGITENIINTLSRLHRVQVIAPSLVCGFRGQKVDPQKVTRALGTDAVLSGSVLVSGDDLIIRTELMDVANGWQIWGEKYSRRLSDILTLQHEISMQISEKLLANLSPDEEKRHGRQHTADPEAYQSYLRGRYFWKKRTAEGYRRAIEEFEQAVILDPTYALAYSGLADSYIAYNLHSIMPPWETSPKAKAAVIQALVIDDTLPEAHTSLACVKMMYERDWAGAEREFKRAIELDPTYAQAFNWYSHFLMAMGRVDESFAQSQIALALDPLDDNINQYLGWHYIHARQFDRAVSQLEKTLQINPDFFLARVTLGVAHSQRKDFSKAIVEFERAGEVEHHPLLSAFLGYAYAMAGRVQEANKMLTELKALSTRKYVSPHSIALIHIALNEKQEAFEWFKAAYAEHNEWLNWIKVTPEFDSLHSDPRFIDILLRLGLKPD